MIINKIKLNFDESLCPSCFGKMKVISILKHNARDFDREWVKCKRCKGKGYINLDMLEWIKDGKLLHQKRLSLSWTVKKMAIRLGIDESHLLLCEAGYVNVQKVLDFAGFFLSSY